MSSTGIIILAGGKSSRMGRDKGLIEVGGQPIIQYVINNCLPVSEDITIVSNQPEYSVFGFPVIEDEFKELGPLAGLYTGLNQSRHDCNVVLSCDTPLVNTKLLQKLNDNLTGDLDAVISKHSDKTHPLIGVYHKRLAPIIHRALLNGERRMMWLIDQVNSKEVNCNLFSPEMFLNLNTPSDLEQFQKLTRKI